jgi:hypothetical protein
VEALREVRERGGSKEQMRENMTKVLKNFGREAKKRTN